MTRRQFFLTPFAASALVIKEPWEWTWVNGSTRGLFIHRAQKCLSIYKQGSQRVILYWVDIQKQRLPIAIGWWDGKFRFQSPIWKGSPKATKLGW